MTSGSKANSKRRKRGAWVNMNYPPELDGWRRNDTVFDRVYRINKSDPGSNHLVNSVNPVKNSYGQKVSSCNESHPSRGCGDVEGAGGGGFVVGHVEVDEESSDVAPVFGVGC